MRAIDASSVTSTKPARASPPSSVIIAAVSRADSMRWSATQTRAPSRASSMAVARPLPIVAPGVCPPPTTIAILLPSSMCLPPVRIRVRYDRRPSHDGGSDVMREAKVIGSEQDGGSDEDGRTDMSRLSELDEKNLAPEARAFVEALNSGPRGKIGLIGPFGVWAHSPRIG